MQRDPARRLLRLLTSACNECVPYTTGAIPVTIQRCMSLHVALGLLSWADLLEDGNLLWEIALTEVRTRDRPAAAICPLRAN